VVNWRASTRLDACRKLRPLTTAWADSIEDDFDPIPAQNCCFV
jgi:hypothetical protein